MGPVLPDLIDVLVCPHCGESLAEADRSLRCVNGHTFDVAKQGYVNLLPGDARTGTADTPAMVAARDAFLGKGHYTPIADALAEAAARLRGDVGEGCVVDVGGGTGYYLARVLDALPDRRGLVLDISKHAAKRAARVHPRAAAAVADAWKSLPVRSGAAALVLDVFAPRNAEEFRRVLRPGGVLLVVTPTGRHLAGLVDTLGLLKVDERKAERLDATLGGAFEQLDAREIEWKLRLSAEDVATVVAMGPSSWHTDADALAERIAALPRPTEVQASVTLSAWRARG